MEQASWRCWSGRESAAAARQRLLAFGDVRRAASIFVVRMRITALGLATLVQLGYIGCHSQDEIKYHVYCPLHKHMLDSQGQTLYTLTPCEQ